MAYMSREALGPRTCSDARAAMATLSGDGEGTISHGTAKGVVAPHLT